MSIAIAKCTSTPLFARITFSNSSHVQAQSHEDSTRYVSIPFILRSRMHSQVWYAKHHFHIIIVHYLLTKHLSVMSDAGRAYNGPTLSHTVQKACFFLAIIWVPARTLQGWFHDHNVTLSKNIQEKMRQHKVRGSILAWPGHTVTQNR